MMQKRYITEKEGKIELTELTEFTWHKEKTSFFSVIKKLFSSDKPSESAEKLVREKKDDLIEKHVKLNESTEKLTEFVWHEENTGFFSRVKGFLFENKTQDDKEGLAREKSSDLARKLLDPNGSANDDFKP